LAAKVKDLKATGPVQEGLSRELAAAQEEDEELEKKLKIKKSRSAKLERWLDKCCPEPESTEQTGIAQLQIEKDMSLHQDNDLLSEKSGLESDLTVFEHIIQRLTTNQVQATQVPLPGPFVLCGSSELTSGYFGIHGSTEPTLGLPGSCDFSLELSDLPTPEGKRTFHDVTPFQFALE
jgi:hypothetical protein